MNIPTIAVFCSLIRGEKRVVCLVPPPDQILVAVKLTESLCYISRLIIRRMTHPITDHHSAQAPRYLANVAELTVVKFSAPTVLLRKS